MIFIQTPTEIDLLLINLQGSAWRIAFSTPLLCLLLTGLLMHSMQYLDFHVISQLNVDFSFYFSPSAICYYILTENLESVFQRNIYIFTSRKHVCTDFYTTRILLWYPIKQGYCFSWRRTWKMSQNTFSKSWWRSSILFKKLWVENSKKNLDKIPEVMPQICDLLEPSTSRQV